MDLADVRDWIIVIYGAVGVVATIIVLTLILITYAKVSRILDSLQTAADNIRDTTSVISDVIVRPFNKIRSFMESIRKAIGLFVPTEGKKGSDQSEQ